MSHTIFALSSGRPPSGVSVIRLSGPDALTIASAFAPGAPLQPRKAHYRHIVDPTSGEQIDSGLIIAFPQPHSFTGEDSAEFQVHGSRAVFEALSNALIAQGARPADAGEFTQRAFKNGKMDLAQAEGLADLIEADTVAQLKLAQTQASGRLSALYDQWRAQLVELQALIEAELDFSDEDLPEDLLGLFHVKLSALRGTFEDHLAKSQIAERVRDGIKIVIAGPPNAGKSCLLNTLSQRDIAIVSPEAGTTRDSLEVYLNLGGFAVTIVDTAGLRDATSQIEQDGIHRAMRHLESADIVIDMAAVDIPAPTTVRVDVPTLSVINKIDLDGTGVPETDRLALSLKSGEGIGLLIDQLTHMVAQQFDLGESTVTSQARHRAALQGALIDLHAAIALAQNQDADLVLLAEHLRRIAVALGRIVGHVDVEDVLGAIFSRFCIGK